MFGNTFSNLQNEILFVRNSLLGFAPGDFLLLNVPAAMAAADDIEAIRRKDRRFAGQLPTTDMSAQDRMYCDLLERHIPGVKSTEIKWLPRIAACPVPGSYAANLRGTVKTHHGETKQFSVVYNKRYDPQRLDGVMAQEGWGSRSRSGVTQKSTIRGSCCCTSAPAIPSTRRERSQQPVPIDRFAVTPLMPISITGLNN